MKKIWLVTGSLLLLLLAGCGEKDAGSLPAAPTTPVAAGDMTLQLEELVTDPVAFEGKLVQVSGRYSVLPMPPCDSALYLPPATWLLGDGGVIVRMAGLQGILEALASDGLAMIVEGRWERWDGWIGCGDAAVSSTIWYLQAMRILTNIEGVSIIKFDERDIVRHKLVKRIVRAYEQEENEINK